MLKCADPVLIDPHVMLASGQEMWAQEIQWYGQIVKKLWGSHIFGILPNFGSPYFCNR